MDRVQHWLGLCDSHHKCAPILPELPTRVLDLGEESYPKWIKLVETKGCKGRYIALSHCWGSSHRITTKKSTFEARKRGMSIAELPSTFQQAALIAKSLGVTYLWIDSLCIIQDSPSDWEYEASRMGDVYANSYLTIASSSSLDDSSGCFPSLEAKDSPYVSPEAALMSLNVAANIGPYVISATTVMHRPTLQKRCSLWSMSKRSVKMLNPLHSSLPENGCPHLASGHRESIQSARSVAPSIRSRKNRSIHEPGHFRSESWLLVPFTLHQARCFGCAKNAS